MVEFKRSDSDKLSENFGIPAEEFEAVAEVWDACQDEMNKALKDGFSKPTGEYEGADGVMFDSTTLLKIFFKHFNTQELQDAALIQFLGRDIEERAENHVRNMAREAFVSMMRDVQGDIIGEDDQPDLDEII